LLVEMEMAKLRIGAVIAAALALAAVQECWAGHLSSRGNAHRSTYSAARISGTGVPRPILGVRAFPTGVAPTAVAPRPHHHYPGRTVFFVGAPYWYWAWPYGYAYLPPPYYYGPDYGVPKQEMPTVYVEKFDGEPTPQTTGDIYCPSANAYYPEVQHCAGGGWQRIIQEAPINGAG
jgi:hypothetical protein